MVETFSGLSVSGNPSGSRRVDGAINDRYAGSRYIRITNLNSVQPQPVATISRRSGRWHRPGRSRRRCAGDGASEDRPRSRGRSTSTSSATSTTSPRSTAIRRLTTTGSAPRCPRRSFTDRQDIFVINDSAPPRMPNQDSSGLQPRRSSRRSAPTLGDSYSASYGPWIIIPHPQRVGTTLIAVPPGGAVMGMMARIDATVGVFRAPAGVIAGLNNAVGVQTKFTDTELGDLNSNNINIIRSVVGAGICVHGWSYPQDVRGRPLHQRSAHADLHQGSAAPLDPVRRVREQRPAAVERPAHDRRPHPASDVGGRRPRGCPAPPRPTSSVATTPSTRPRSSSPARSGWRSAWRWSTPPSS